MKILFLDDNNLRHELVAKILGKKHDIIHARKAEEGICLLLKTDLIGIALLDHDLGDFFEDLDGKRYERHGVYFINRMFNDITRELWPKQFILHSNNPIGSHNMFTDLTAEKCVATKWMFSAQMLNDLAIQL